jgi:hypothetical protein
LLHARYTSIVGASILDRGLPLEAGVAMFNPIDTGGKLVIMCVWCVRLLGSKGVDQTGNSSFHLGINIKTLVHDLLEEQRERE